MRCVLTSERGKRVEFHRPRRQCSPFMSFRVLYPFQPAWILVAANSTARGSNLLGSERTDGGFLDVIFCEIWLWFHAVTWKKFMSRNVCVVIESPTFRLGELLCLLEELRRRHLLVRGRRAASASAEKASEAADLIFVLRANSQEKHCLLGFLEN